MLQIRPVESAFRSRIICARVAKRLKSISSTVGRVATLEATVGAIRALINVSCQRIGQTMFGVIVNHRALERRVRRLFQTRYHLGTSGLWWRRRARWTRRRGRRRWLRRWSWRWHVSRNNGRHLRCRFSNFQILLVERADSSRNIIATSWNNNLEGEAGARGRITSQEATICTIYALVDFASQRIWETVSWVIVQQRAFECYVEGLLESLHLVAANSRWRSWRWTWRWSWRWTWRRRPVCCCIQNRRHPQPPGSKRQSILTVKSTGCPCIISVGVLDVRKGKATACGCVASIEAEVGAIFALVYLTDERIWQTLIGLIVQLCSIEINPKSFIYAGHLLAAHGHRRRGR